MKNAAIRVKCSNKSPHIFTFYIYVIDENRVGSWAYFAKVNANVKETIFSTDEFIYELGHLLQIVETITELCEAYTKGTQAVADFLKKYGDFTPPAIK